VKVGRTLAILATVLMVGMWAYILYLAIGPGRQDSPDKIADPAFATRAQSICDRALDEIAELQPASEASDARARSEVIEQADAELARMLEELEEIVPGGDDGVVVRRWLADWHTYLGDREAYADRLRTEPDARLYVTAKQGNQITEFLDQFAKDNDIPACSTPADVG
jgi:hypothetical protein